MKFSIIIPAYNEAENLREFVEAFLAAATPEILAVLHEVIVVENGSRDETLKVANELRARHPETIVVRSLGRGSYGEAIRLGMKESSGTHLSILELDFLDVDFVAESIRLFERGEASFIVASKRHPRSIDGRPFKRRLLTLLFNRLLNVFLRYPGSDTHGLKSIESSLAKKLCELGQTTDEVFQTEIVLIAWRLGYDIVELPIRIEEKRPMVVSVARRLPKVANLLKDLRRSLARFPARPKSPGPIDEVR